MPCQGSRAALLARVEAPDALQPPPTHTHMGAWGPLSLFLSRLCSLRCEEEVTTHVRHLKPEAVSSCLASLLVAVRTLTARPSQVSAMAVCAHSVCCCCCLLFVVVLLLLCVHWNRLFSCTEGT